MTQVSKSPRDLVGSVTYRRMFESPTAVAPIDPISALIAREVAALRAQWVQFQHSLPENSEEKLRLDTFEPSIEGVVSLVEAIQTRWEENRRKGALGKTSYMFHKFCGTLDSHSSLLQVLPEGSEYVSVFTGTLNAVIQASANHEKIADGLAQALVTISEHISECKVELEIFSTKAIREKVADLYSHIFRFLGSVMDWLMRKRVKRMLGSFNENLYKKFEDDIATIKGKAEVIRNAAAQSARAEGRITRLTVEELRRELLLGHEGEAQHRAEMQFYAARIERQSREGPKELRQLSQDVREMKDSFKWMLEAHTSAYLDVNPQQLYGLPSQLLLQDHSLLSPQRSRPLTPNSTQMQWTLEDVCMSSKGLEDKFDRSRVRLDVDFAHPLAIPQEALSRVEVWAADPALPLLWIDGPPIDADGVENQLSLLASVVLENASQAGVPVVSYFCDLPRGTRPGGRDTREMQGAMSLLAGLVRQMVELLPEEFCSEHDLSPRRFELVTGTGEAWSDGIGLLRDLASLLAGRVLCIVDGLHLLDDRSSSRQIRELIQVLRKPPFKVLLTTSGRAPTLRNEIDRREMLGLERLGKTAAVCLNLDILGHRI